ADSRARSNNAAPLTTAPSIRLLAGLYQAPSNHDVTGSHKPDFQPCTHVPPGTPKTFGALAGRTGRGAESRRGEADDRPGPDLHRVPGVSEVPHGQPLLRLQAGLVERGRAPRG